MIKVTPNEWADHIAKHNYYFTEPNNKTLLAKRREDGVELGMVKYSIPEQNEYLINLDVHKLNSSKI